MTKITPTQENTGKTVAADFREHFGRPRALFRAPARTNIIGEHCDYNDGLVMPVNMALFTWLAIAPRDDRLVRIRAANFDQLAEVNLDNIQSDPAGGWKEYPKGVLHVLQKKGFELQGADVSIHSNIPIGGGLSSSASLETVMAMAMLSNSGHAIDRQQLAWMCKEAENDFVGVACGIMDQYIISLGSSGKAMMLDCRSMEYEQVPLPKNAGFLLVHSGVQHSLNDGGFNTRQQQCQQVVDRLKVVDSKIAALRDVSLDQLDQNKGELDDVLYRRARHVVTEIQRVGDARQAMSAEDPARLGELMNASHESLKNDFEVSCDELDALVAIARDCRGVLGSRMVGAGFGGCTVSLVETDRIDAVASEISRRYEKLLGREPWAQIVEAADSVRQVELS